MGVAWFPRVAVTLVADGEMAVASGGDEAIGLAPRGWAQDLKGRELFEWSLKG